MSVLQLWEESNCENSLSAIIDIEYGNLFAHVSQRIRLQYGWSREKCDLISQEL